MAELVIARPGIFDQGEKQWSDLLNIGVAYLAGSARVRGLSVKVVEGKNERHTSIDETLEAIKAHNPSFVGISAMTTEYPMAVELASRLKEFGDGPVIILGGIHASTLPVESLAEAPAVDYVLVGEAENTLVDLIEAVKKGGELDHIPGLYQRDEDGKPFSASPKCDIVDVTSLPFPGWDFVPLVDAYPVVTGRGCPYNCVFCGKNLGRLVRLRPVEHIMEEINWLHSEFHPPLITFADETFGIKKKHAEELLLQLIEFHKKTGVNFMAQTRVDHISKEIVDLMKKAGFSYVSFGVESGDPEVLARSGKAITLDQVEKAVKIVKEAGIDHRLFFILGLPGETRQTVRRTINFAVKLNPSKLSVALIVPYPGTDIYQWALEGKNGYRLLSKDFRQFDKYLGASLELDSISFAVLRKMQMQMYFEVYLRNFRFGELAKLLYGKRSLFVSYLKNILAHILPGRKKA